MQRFHPLVVGAISLVLLLSLAAPGAIARFAPDRNRDKIPDSWERRHRLSLKVNQAGRDQDRDRVSNLCEFQAGIGPRRDDSDNDQTRDGDEDSDGDGLANAVESRIRLGCGSADTDRDGIGDVDEDADADGASNGDELAAGTDPLYDDRAGESGVNEPAAEGSERGGCDLDDGQTVVEIKA